MKMPQLKSRLKKYYYEYIVVFLVLLILLLINALPFEVFNSLSYRNKAITFFIIVMVIFRLQSFFPFLLALISLAAIPILLIVKNNEIAETFAIAAYYFLMIGVIKEIVSLRKEAKTL